VSVDSNRVVDFIWLPATRPAPPPLVPIKDDDPATLRS
jgi:hypothetical protein